MHPVIIQALAEERNRDMQACAAEARQARQARHAGRARRAAPRPAPGVLSPVGTASSMHLPCLPWRLPRAHCSPDADAADRNGSGALTRSEPEMGPLLSSP